MNMNKEQIKQHVAEMHQRIVSVENTIYKMMQSERFPEDDPRFEHLENLVTEMNKHMTQLAMSIGERPYTLEINNDSNSD